MCSFPADIEQNGREDEPLKLVAVERRCTEKVTLGCLEPLQPHPGIQAVQAALPGHEGGGSDWSVEGGPGSGHCPGPPAGQADSWYCGGLLQLGSGWGDSSDCV